jgi:hypothetical protein
VEISAAQAPPLPAGLEESAAQAPPTESLTVGIEWED